MSLFGSMLFDADDDSIFGFHMRSMRQMNNIMSSMMSDPFEGMFRGLDAIAGPPTGISNQIAATNRNALMPFEFPDFNVNRLLMNNMPPNNGMSFSSSSFISMTRGPDGRQQVYKATSSSKSGPGGICETKKTVQDSRTGIKKMAIGHHIGERAHIVEKQKNDYTGEEEEKVDLINLDEDEAEEFDHEFDSRASAAYGIPQRSEGSSRQLALPAPPPAAITYPITNPIPTDEEESTPEHELNDQECNNEQVNSTSVPLSRIQGNRRGIRNNITNRRSLRSPASSPLTSPSSHTSSTSVHPHPYNMQSRRQQHRAMKGSYHQPNAGPH